MNQIQIVILSFFFLIQGGCQWTSSRPELNSDTAATESENKPLVESKYRLSTDRAALDEVRKQIPEETKVENDETAMILTWMSEIKITPSEVRSKFDSIYRKKRELFEKDIKKSRELFNKDQARAKVEFQKKTDEKKSELKNKKLKNEDRKIFNEDIIQLRKEFYSDQKEKRDEFEFNNREKRKEFDDYLRSKRSEFDQEWRSYNKRFQAQKASESAQKRDQDKVRPASPY